MAILLKQIRCESQHDLLPTFALSLNEMDKNKDNIDLSLPFRGTGGIIPLSEGSFTIDKTKLFVPFDEKTDELQQRPVGSLLVEIQPFVAITSKDILLLDTGLGFNDAANGKMQLHTNLERAGIRPEQITKVLMSHLHKDHAGGVCMNNEHTKLSLPQCYLLRTKKRIGVCF